MNCVIACHKRWCSDKFLAERLNKLTSSKFLIIDERGELTLSKLNEIRPEYIFFPHWSYSIPDEILSKYKCVIFHMTDLPYGRGGSPLQNLIVRGHQETVMSAIKCVKQLDAGPIYFKEKLSLLGSAEEIYLRASRLIESMIVRILSEQPKPIDQAGKVTLFSRRTPDQGNWSDVSSLEDVFDRIRMLDADGYPKAFLDVGPFKLEFCRASLKTNYVIADVKISKLDE